jgi:hypothetical protein
VTEIVTGPNRDREPGTADAVEPSPAERARTIMAAATSLTVSVPASTGRREWHLAGCHDVGPHGDLRLRDGIDLDAGAKSALVEFTDIAPVAMRQRVRARLTLAGRLAPCPPRSGLLFTPTTARLGVLARTVELTAESLGAAAPDMLAEAEANLLCHLADAHRDVVERLARLVPAERLHGVRAVLPLRLDRFGIVLRLEYVSRDRDVRLPFTPPLRAATEAPTRVLSLLAGAHRCPRRGR